MSRDVSLNDRIMEINTRVLVREELLPKENTYWSQKSFDDLFYSFLNNNSRTNTGNFRLPLDKPFDPSVLLGENWATWKNSPYDEGNDVDPNSSLTKIELASFLRETFPIGRYKRNSCNEIVRVEAFRYQEKEFLELLYFTSNIFFYLWSDHNINKENSVLEWLRKNDGVFSIRLGGVILPIDWYRFGQRGFKIDFWRADFVQQNEIKKRRFRIDRVDAFPNAYKQDNLDRRSFSFGLIRNATGNWLWKFSFSVNSQWEYIPFSSGYISNSAEEPIYANR